MKKRTLTLTGALAALAFVACGSGASSSGGAGGEAGAGGHHGSPCLVLIAKAAPCCDMMADESDKNLCNEAAQAVHFPDAATCAAAAAHFKCYSLGAGGAGGTGGTSGSGGAGGTSGTSGSGGAGGSGGSCSQDGTFCQDSAECCSGMCDVGSSACNSCLLADDPCNAASPTPGCCAGLVCDAGTSTCQ